MINPDVLLNLKRKLCGMDESVFLEELIETFLKFMPVRIAELHAALDLQDYEKIGYVAHTSKSSAATVGAQTLADLCQKIENLALKKNETEWAQSIAQLTENLDAIFQQTQKDLTALRSELCN